MAKKQPNKQHVNIYALTYNNFLEHFGDTWPKANRELLSSLKKRKQPRQQAASSVDPIKQAVAESEQEAAKVHVNAISTPDVRFLDDHVQAAVNSVKAQRRNQAAKIRNVAGVLDAIMGLMSALYMVFAIGHQANPWLAALGLSSMFGTWSVFAIVTTYITMGRDRGSKQYILSLLGVAVMTTVCEIIAHLV